jgi:hypothetical protein
VSRIIHGWNRSRTPLRKTFGMHPAAALTEIPLSVDHGSSSPAIFDQGDVGSCWAHAASRGLFASVGTTFVPSMDGIYRNARCLMRAAGEFSGALTDTGTDPFYGMQAISQFGVKPMGPAVGRNSDCSTTSMVREPMLDELEEDAHHLMVGAHQIISAGTQRVEDICRALAAGCAVIVGVFVDTAFEDWTPSQGPIGAPRNPNDPNGGGHALCIDGYDTTQLGRRILTVANSWAEDWGDHGRFLAAPEWITNDQAGDIYVLSVTSQEAS